jgi:CheY-like chemotaxis protein
MFESMRKIRTLVADDSPPVLDMLMSILQRDGRTTLVGTVSDGWQVLPEALKLTPDLVLMDLRLPHIDSAEVTRYLKLMPKPPRVFIITADDSPAARQSCIDSGADAFVTKSVNIEAQLTTELNRWFS